MLQKLQKQKNGFTIIETMIVLAIAGLIMLIVFLAVPALERSARNTQRKNDVSAIASAIADYIDDNGGTMPTGVASADGTNANLAIGSTATGATNSETAKLGYYTAGTVTTMAATSGNVYINNIGSTLTTPTLSATASATAVTTNSVIIEVGEDCNTSNTAAGALNSRTAAIFYATENTGNGSEQCLEQ